MNIFQESATFEVAALQTQIAYKDARIAIGERAMELVQEYASDPAKIEQIVQEYGRAVKDAITREDEAAKNDKFDSTRRTNDSKPDKSGTKKAAANKASKDKAEEKEEKNAKEAKRNANAKSTSEQAAMMIDLVKDGKTYAEAAIEVGMSMDDLLAFAASVPSKE